MALVIKDHGMDQAERTTILAVEDEALIRMISADILEEAGFRVLEAANAAEAILIMEGADHVELMFTDIRMPGRMNGLELAAFVHAHWPDVRLLVTSGHIVLTDSEIPDGGRFVRKPYDLKQRVAEVRASVASPPPSG
jgi:CheY-like chemotaxis protein